MSGKKTYLGFGGKLHHEIPNWVHEDAIFHIRIRCAAGARHSLIEPALAPSLLDSVTYYQQRGKWFAHLFLLMPDHLHALLSFPQDQVMSHAIGDWKRYQARTHGIEWQEGYFDHRLRGNDTEITAKATYILRNPVVAGLCETPEDWPWWIATSGSDGKSNREIIAKPGSCDGTRPVDHDLRA